MKCVFICLMVFLTILSSAAELSGIIDQQQWWQEPDCGYDCHGIRRNFEPGSTQEYGKLKITLVAALKESVIFDFSVDGKEERIVADSKSAFNWDEYHFAVLDVRIYGKKKLVELEVCEKTDVPEEILNSSLAGDVKKRARMLHEIDCITLHHCGDAKPMEINEDPVKKIRNLRIWGMRDKLWWTVPYHFLIAADGRILVGRPWKYMGETSTLYNPKGHLLISAMGNYDIQKPSEAVLNSIVRIMVWAVLKFDLKVDSIKGHKDYSSDTTCPGKYLAPFLDNGYFKDEVRRQISRK